MKAENKVWKPYPIVCIKPYEFEGKKFLKGEIRYHSYGINIPDGWRKASQKDIDDYVNSGSKYFRQH